MLAVSGLHCGFDLWLVKSCFFLFELNNIFFCVLCVWFFFFFCLCDAFVPKGILLYESLWWWLCKFHIFSSLHFLIAQVPSSHLASASVSPFSLLLLSLCPSWPPNIFLHHTLLTICAFPPRLSQFKRMFGFICSKDDDSHCSSTLILAFSSQLISQFHFSSLMLIVIFCFVF